MCYYVKLTPRDALKPFQKRKRSRFSASFASRVDTLLKLIHATTHENIIYVISEPEHIKLLPEGTIKILVSADIDTIKERFKARIRRNLPGPVAQMLEKKHGIFEDGSYDYRFDGVAGDAAALCDSLKNDF